MAKLILILTILFSFVGNFDFATASKLWFKPRDQVYSIGDTLRLDLYADIDEADAIFGFGFDLSFDNGTSSIGGPGEKGNYLTFTDFTPNYAYFQYDTTAPPVWDDGDTIAGEVPFGKPNIWGSGILLGTFSFEIQNSHSISSENIYLTPTEGDYGTTGEEGLLGATAFMPNNPETTAHPNSKPGTFTYLSFGLIGFAIFKKKLTV